MSEYNVDWDALLAQDGSLLFLSPPGNSPVFEEHQRPLLTLEEPTPAKRSAVAPRRRTDDNIVVEETGSSFGLGIVDCALYFETRWTCGACRTSYKKPGRHNGVLKKCRGCGARFFLRLTPLPGR